MQRSKAWKFYTLMKINRTFGKFWQNDPGHGWISIFLENENGCLPYIWHMINWCTRVTFLCESNLSKKYMSNFRIWGPGKVMDFLNIFCEANKTYIKVNWGFLVTPKLGVASILCCNFIIQKRQYLEQVEHNQRIAVDPLRVLLVFLYNKVPT